MYLAAATNAGDIHLHEKQPHYCTPRGWLAQKGSASYRTSLHSTFSDSKWEEICKARAWLALPQVPWRWCQGGGSLCHPTDRGHTPPALAELFHLNTPHPLGAGVPPVSRQPATATDGQEQW